MWAISRVSSLRNRVFVLVFLLVAWGSSALAGEAMGIATRCYAKRYYPFPYELVFQALKETFLRANFTFKNMNKESGFLFGTGILKRGKKVYFLNLSANLTPQGEVTLVNVLANYIQMKKEHLQETAGLNGICFPIPVFWKKEMITKDMGVLEDPNFYQVFFANLNKVIFEEILRSPEISPEDLTQLSFLPPACLR